MKRAIVLQHVPFEGPAAIAPLCEELGYSLDVRRLDLGAEVPTAIAPDELLIVMGGPMGVGDIDDPAYPFLAREVELLRRVLLDDAPMLGVCLGAQLLAHAAGARVYPAKHPDGSRCYEVGWGSLTVQRGGAAASLTEGLPDEMTVLHWHGDTFDLPEGALHLASTAACPNQAFRSGRRQFGLQFHCEAGAAEVAVFLHEDAAFVEKANGPGGVEVIERATRRLTESSRGARERLLRNLLAAMAAPR